MRKYPLDFIQVNYSIMNRNAVASVLPVAQERGAAVPVNLPLARAALIGQVGQQPLPDWAVDRPNRRTWRIASSPRAADHRTRRCAREWNNSGTPNDSRVSSL